MATDTFVISAIQLASLCDLKPYEYWVEAGMVPGVVYDLAIFTHDKMEKALKEANIDMTFEQFHYLGIDQTQKIPDSDPRVIELEKHKKEILEKPLEDDDYRHCFKSLDENKRYKEIMTSLVIKDFKLGRFPFEVSKVTKFYYDYNERIQKKAITMIPYDPIPLVKHYMSRHALVYDSRYGY